MRDMINMGGKRAGIIAGISILLLVCAVAAIWFWRQGNLPKQAMVDTDLQIEGFSFLGVGRNTTHDGNLKNMLEASLGSIAIESRVTIDLEKNYRGFLKKHFPQLETFNRFLNDATGARVEHAATRWMFRYAQSRNTPFKYVEFLFSDDRGTPLYIQVTAQNEGSELLEKVREKFHDPAQIPWDNGLGRSLVWRFEEDVFIASLLKDRFGNPECRIVIYFTGTIAHLIETEKANTAKQHEIREKAGESAF